MITLVDIKKSINNVLKNNFPDVKIYSSDTKEGFNRPAFFTQIVPLTSDYETVNYTSNRLMVAIQYFSESGTELENLKMDEDLRKAFGMILKVNQRTFLLKNIRSEIVDEVLQFKFDLNFFDGVEVTKEEYEIMKQLNMNLKE
jgi:hypothetical protein